MDHSRPGRRAEWGLGFGTLGVGNAAGIGIVFSIEVVVMWLLFGVVME